MIIYHKSDILVLNSRPGGPAEETPLKVRYISSKKIIFLLNFQKKTLSLGLFLVTKIVVYDWSEVKWIYHPQHWPPPPPPLLLTDPSTPLLAYPAWRRDLNGPPVTLASTSNCIIQSRFGRSAKEGMCWIWNVFISMGMWCENDIALVS